MLRELLENATTVEDEVFDVRFEEVVTLIDQEKFEEANSLISEIFQEGVLDIRLVMYKLFSQFISEGICSLKEIFPTIVAIMDDYWDKISPVQTRERYLTHSLNWFFSSISKKIKRSEKLYKDKKPDDFWKKSLHGLTADGIDELISICKSLAEKIDDPSLTQFILFIPKWLEGIRTVISPVKKAEPKVIVSPASPEKKIEVKEISLSETLNASEPMNQLVKKLKGFQQLIEEKHFEKAALVADDIATILKNFDPAVYFPKLFTSYFALTAAHMDRLAEQWENKGSLKWEALNRLYQSDLEEFIKW